MSEHEEQSRADEWRALQMEAQVVDGEVTGSTAPPGAPSAAEMLRPLVDFGVDVFCPGWEVQDQEREHLANAYGALVEKYAPGGITAFSVEMQAALVTAAIFGPRVAAGMPRRTNHEDEQQKEETGEAQEGGDHDH